MMALFSAIKPTTSDTVQLIATPGSPTGEFTQISGGLVKPSSIIVAGMDITAWQIVEVNVPAGPLGILLDGSCADAALLDDFAPVAREGTPGAVEASGKVPHGSVLVGMDKTDFMQEPRKTLAEIGTILREAAHLKRQLRFRVPPQNYQKMALSTPQSPEQDDKAQLLLGPTSSSTSLVEGSDNKKSAGEWSSWMWSGLRAATALATPRTATPEGQTTSPTAESTAAMPTVPAVAKSTGRSPSFVRVTGMEDRALESDTHPFVPSASDKVVSVEVPAGSLGLHLDGSVANRAVVLGFIPLPDGSRGALERNGSVPSGAEIVEINGEDVSHESLAGIRERLGRLSSEPRRLSFRLPPPVKLTVQPPPTTATPAPAPVSRSPSRRISAVSLQRMSLASASEPTYSEDIELRRRLELKLVMTYDRKELKFKECWFAVHADWMNRWALFVGKGGPLPGPITNHELLQPGWDTASEDPNRAAFVRSGLEIMKDFRLVTPMVWSLFVALHGEGDAPPIARFTLDINSEAPDNINEVLHDAKAQAGGLTNSLREKCQVLNK
ncbi:hypothetical protein PHYSODRAFT_248726 [Phytophthora sojae]|uniref:DUSP domain-containing protein n=1 Tax=Phytophthora sojae (strain P6497) TaxID=1094619 RepID=G4ZY76_PHYSP|nr:hypothetical protein PHYSODRAFT_248726 [Phytophthora sojae]EGZ12688.1 hypothetical protein PHYSODRAFT_248726 [Phytophthora sojae]|eukprot:XP_009533021.1 hypothetical protein PHYSODRAFT_248726 [Phytophthora sojae]